jgi:hypothetical protein
MSGNKVYEGPATEITGWESLPQDIGPHQILTIPFETGFGYPTGVYTFEVGWRAKAGTCPLTGAVGQKLFTADLSTFTQTTTPMVNVVQVLK